ncbi:MAG TPA: TIGR01777 family oxidoreductase [Bryobacteraceae bacterium]|nr:TIGR01777 family oxidoreductase [Bryobacteraceae bacterium]
MRIVLTGASGFVGGRLVPRLQARGHECVAMRHRDGWRAEVVENADAVIHLAGEPVAQRWTTAAKRRIRESRVEGTRSLVRTIGELARKPAVLVSGSAIGFYGERGDEVLTEASAPGEGFLADVAREWESAADGAAALGVRVVKIRTGIALGREGGTLAKLLPMFRTGAGGRVASGRQWMSWIHVDDLADLFAFAAENGSVSGVLNGAAPDPVTNREFTRALARAVHRPAVFPVPLFALRLLYGEMAEVVAGSQRVLPRAAEEAGFRFRYPELPGALEQILE